MCLDASMKSEEKDDNKELVSECSEAAARELDYLKLTDRLYMCEEYRDEISLYLRTLQVIIGLIINMPIQYEHEGLFFDFVKFIM